jgi:RHS repeat-associated protein
VRSAYDASGNVLTETDPGDADATISSYNPDGSLAKQTNPDSSWTTYGYDLDGNKVSETNPKSGYGHGSDPSKVATTSYTYDWANRLASETKPNGMSTVCGYDELGSQVSATGNGGPATTTTYNTLGWVLRTVDANGITDSKSYDTAGRVTSETKGSQNATTSSYNDDNQLTSQTDPDGRLVTNSYDLFGNLKEEQHTVGGTVVKDITTSHDSLNRPTLSLENVSGEGHSWTYPLNTAAGVTEVVTPAGGGPTQTTISRDARNQETQRSTAISGNPTALVRTVDSRDAVDRVTQATLGGSNVQHWSYDSGCGRQVRQWGSGWASGAANADAYTYDQDTGQKSGDNLQLSLGGTVGGSYTYDGNRRLATASVNGVSENYTFDAAGNLTQIVAGATTSTLHYNAADRLTELDKTGGVNSTTIYLGNATYGWRTSQGPTQQNQPITYTYTATGRLAGYGDTTRNLTATYAYDASGQRQQSTVTVGSTTTTTTYVYDGLTLNELSASRSDGANWLIDYVYDENGVPYAGVYDGSSYSGLVFGMITSDRGDVVELVDANGNAFACYHYDAWGNPVGGASDQWGKPTGITVTTTSLITTQQLALDIATRQVLRYAGYVYDPESYLYYCSARSYDPATRQFISPDLAKADGEESAYQYCGGNPVAIVDPTGTKGERFAPKYFYDNTAYFKLVLRRDAGHARLALGYWGTFCWESPGHEWDYKIFYGRTSAQKYTDCWFFLGHWISPDDFGNIHFGYICAEMWYPKWMITWFSRRANTGMPASKEKKDEEFIKWGYQLHHLWGSDMSLKWWHVQYYYR